MNIKDTQKLMEKAKKFLLIKSREKKINKILNNIKSN